MARPARRKADSFAEESALEAEVGDYSTLIWRLRFKSFELSDDERDFLADLLEGKFKLAPHRPKSASRSKRNDTMARMVEELQVGYSVVKIGDDTVRIASAGPMTRQKAVGVVADLFRVKDGTVEKAISESKNRKSLATRDC